MGVLKTLTINGVVYEIKPVVPASYVTLRAAGWVGSEDSYSQVVPLVGITNQTKVDLQPTPEQVEIFLEKTLAFTTENNNGVVTVYSVGDKPEDDYTIQVTLIEVEGSPPIRGNTVGLPNPQADWNQTDPNKADYLKNKPNVATAEEHRSHIADKSNPHAVTAAQVGARADDWLPTLAEIGAAPSGGGYGEDLTAYSAETEAELETKLLEIINTMSNYTTKQVRFTLGFTKVTSYYLTTIFKHTSGYSLVVFSTMRLYGATLIKTYSNGWLSLQWENPPMEVGTEYCTTERYNGKPVYAKAIGLGTLPASGEKSVNYTTDGATKVVSFEAFALSTSGTVNNFPFYNVSGILLGKASATKYGIYINAFSDMSNNTGHATIRYTKD